MIVYPKKIINNATPTIHCILNFNCTMRQNGHLANYIKSYINNNLKNKRVNANHKKRSNLFIILTSF